MEDINQLKTVTLIYSKITSSKTTEEDIGLLLMKKAMISILIGRKLSIKTENGF